MSPQTECHSSRTLTCLAPASCCQASMSLSRLSLRSSISFLSSFPSAQSLAATYYSTKPSSYECHFQSASAFQALNIRHPPPALTSSCLRLDGPRALLSLPVVGASLIQRSVGCNSQSAALAHQPPVTHLDIAHPIPRSGTTSTTSHPPVLDPTAE